MARQANPAKPNVNAIRTLDSDAPLKAPVMSAKIMLTIVERRDLRARREIFFTSVLLMLAGLLV
jgi:hypothetical protein